MRKTSKTLLTLATTFVIATGFSAKAEAASYKVQSGDSLWAISQKYNVSVNELKDINNLTSNTIYVNQILETSRSTSSTTTITAYKVSAGDTLYYIGKRYGVSVTNLKNWNNLKSDMIYPGQVLQLIASPSETTTSKIQSTTSSIDSKVVAEAKKHVGTPYKWGGTSPSGFDCSGFIYYVFKQAGMDITRTSAANYYTQTTKISNPQPGDLVFFSNTYKAGISHMGIYVGDNKFAHASSSGVQITSLDNVYWSKYFTSFAQWK
ncbi:NlpC/P60 family protein [Bacillaceae bacterium S4-13-58]